MPTPRESASRSPDPSSSKGAALRPMDGLVRSMYEELHSLAHRRLGGERYDHTLQTTELVHETYLKLSHVDRIEWQSRSHFLAMAAVAMRRVLIDYARTRNAERRGGGTAVYVTLDGVVRGAEGGSTDGIDLLDLETALTQLATFNPRGAEVVQFRFFAGLTYEEIAEIMGISVPTVRRAWSVAKAWLASELA